jgi:hypothetical protein
MYTVYTATSAYVDRCQKCDQPASEHDWPTGKCHQDTRPGWVVIERGELARLREIEEQAEWVRKGRAISRQAALNAIPDLLRALSR